MRTQSRPSALERWGLLAIVLLAFALRFYRIGDQSYWLDEVYSLRYANISFWEIVPFALEVRDGVAPLFYFFLNPWSALAGQSELACRFLTLMPGVAAIPALFWIGRELLGWRIGLIAALIMTVNPFQVYYAQDNRPYTLTVFLGLLSTLFFLRLLRERAPHKTYAVYILFTSLGIYAHYYNLLLLLFQNTAFLAFAVYRRLNWWRWILSQAAVVLPFLLWTWYITGLLSLYNSPPQTMGEMLGSFGIQASVAWFMPEEISVWAALGFVMVAAVGALAMASARLSPLPPAQRISAPFFILSWLVIPLAAATLGALVYFEISNRFVFGERYLIALTPAYYLLLALGVGVLARLHKALGALALLFLVGTQGYALNNYLNEVNYRNPDFRSTAQHIMAHEKAQDIVLIGQDWAALPFRHYYRGDTLVHAIGIAVPLDEELALIQQKAQLHPRIWWVPANEPWNSPEAWLNANAYKIEGRWFGTARVSLYATELDSPAAMTPLGVRFGEAMALKGYRLGPTRLEAGEAARLHLVWQAQQEMAADYKVTLRLTDSRGHLVAQTDRWPQGGQRRTATWELGEEINDNWGVLVPPGSLPGRYQISVGVYDAATGASLTAVGAQGIPLGDLVPIAALEALTPAVPPPLRMFETATPPRELPLGLQLLDYGLPQAEVGPGAIMTARLLLRAAEPLPRDVAFDLSLTGEDGVVAARKVGSLSAEVFPSHGWRAGEVVRDFIDMRVPPSLAGRYQVWLEVEGEAVALGTVKVRRRQRSFEMPTPQHPADVSLGGLAHLLGYDIDKASIAPGEVLRLTLHWRALTETEAAYAVFVHLVDAQGRLVSQHDGSPAGGAAPTTSWVEGEFIADAHEVPVPALAAPGDYQLRAGLYEPKTGQRLRTLLGDDGVTLTTVRVVP